MNFAITGAAGYIAPRHMKAIKDTGNNLIAALDPNDSVGILDSYFPDCDFFTQVERFDRHFMKERNLDFLSVCTPNYLHESHCKLGLRLGADVICEKPIATTVENLLQLKTVEEQTRRKIYPILQLRLHPVIKLLKEQIDTDDFYDVELDYITPRGQWYFQSWKGKVGKSGGIETNIGIHFFDMLLWIFGSCDAIDLEYHDDAISKGLLHLESAHVKWNLSLRRQDLPDPQMKFYRSMKINGNEVRFDDIFADLHTESYKQILCGHGLELDETLPSIQLVEKLRGM